MVSAEKSNLIGEVDTIFKTLGVPDTLASAWESYKTTSVPSVCRHLKVKFDTNFHCARCGETGYWDEGQWRSVG